MPLTRFGFIVTGAGLEPHIHRAEIIAPAFTMLALGVSSAADGPRAARMLLDSGVQLIELCGGFGPAGTVAVLQAVGGAVPVGSVGYGPESIEGMHALFPPDTSQP